MFEEAARRRERGWTSAVGDPPPVLAAAGSAIVVLSLFLPWFSASRDGIPLPGVSTGWQWFGVLDLVLVAVALTGLAAALRPDDRQLPSVAAYASTAAMIAVIVRAIDPPSVSRFIFEYSVKAGPIVAIAGLACILLATARRVRVPGP
jgi:hypothetical protein